MVFIFTTKIDDKKFIGKIFSNNFFAKILKLLIINSLKLLAIILMANTLAINFLLSLSYRLAAGDKVMNDLYRAGSMRHVVQMLAE